MESSTILTADVLDILFEGRNKEYGAYDLRKSYNRRLTTSITVMLSAIGVLTMGFAFAGKKTKAGGIIITEEVTLAKMPDKPEKQVELPPPPRVKPQEPPAQVKTIKNTTYNIVPDNDVPPPPETTEMEHAQIGKVTQDGDPDGIVAPPVDGDGRLGVVEAPKREEEETTSPFTKVEIESEYPGNWARFLNKNLRYPPEAQDQGIQGFVTVQFIVDKEGNVSDVEAVSGPMELRAEAVRVIKKSGKWTPAIQNGRQVKSYKKQPIGFKIVEE